MTDDKPILDPVTALSIRVDEMSAELALSRETAHSANKQTADVIDANKRLVAEIRALRTVRAEEPEPVERGALDDFRKYLGVR